MIYVLAWALTVLVITFILAIVAIVKVEKLEKNLNGIVKEEDIPFLAESAYNDACRPGNPKDTSIEDITALYKSLL